MRHVHSCAVFGARFLVAFAATAGFTAAASVPEDDQLAQLWQEPRDLSSRDLFHGPWGAQNAPDPAATYSFLKPKEKGVNPGVVVRDSHGRTWHVKQSPSDDDKKSDID